MNELLTERSESILRVQFNRPAKKNAMTLAMYSGLADLLNEADKDENIHVVLLYGAGDCFTAGNDLEDFMKNPPGPGDSPQSRLISALIDFSKPLVAAVHGVAIGGGTTILTHCDFVYAADDTKFQVPFINLALVPEFGSSYSLPRQLGYLHAAELLMLGEPFNAARANEVGLVTAVLPASELMARATEIAQKLARKPASAIKACKDLLKRPAREQLKQSVARETEELPHMCARRIPKKQLLLFLKNALRTLADPKRCSRRSRLPEKVTLVKQSSGRQGGVRQMAETVLPTSWGVFRALAFGRTRAPHGPLETPVALILGSPWPAPSDKAPLVRIHSECLTGDVLGSLRCDCGEQLKRALRAIADEGCGLLIYEQQEGRGIGIIAKLQAYALQDQGLDTIAANQALGYEADYRDFSLPGAILNHLGIRHIRLLSNNPKKRRALVRAGIVVVDQLPCEASPSPWALKYLKTKKERMGHTLSNI